MLTSSIRSQLDTVLTILTDSKKLSKMIEDLKKADKEAKESMKELSKGKSFASALKEIQEETQKCKEEVSKAKRYLKGVTDKANEIIEDAKKEAALVAEVIKAKQSSVDATMAESRQVLKDAEDCYVEADKANKKAQLDQKKATALKEEYQLKLGDIKNRFSGLV